MKKKQKEAIIIDLQDTDQATDNVHSNSLLHFQQNKILSKIPETESLIQPQHSQTNEMFQEYPLWFKLNQIHDYEAEQVQQFFIGYGYKTPEVYQKYRNFIVELYQKHPSQYLTKIACRSALRGDCNAIARIHNFLEKQGIINCKLSLKRNFKWNGPSLKSIKPDRSISNPSPISLSLYPTSKAFLNRKVCDKCKKMCGVIYFSKTETGENICQHCYQNLKQGFEKRIEKDSKGNWSVQDRLKLTQLVFEGNKWEQISNKFEGMAKQNIVHQFLQLPTQIFSLEEKPAQSKIELSVQKQIDIIRQFYRKSQNLRNITDFKQQTGISQGLTQLIKVQLSKLENELDNLYQMEQAYVICEFVFNISKIINEIRLCKKYEKDYNKIQYVCKS